MTSESSPDPIDLHVGVQIRQRRRELGISQGALAESVAITFQQVQKYERGSNRVSASKLFGIAATLGMPVASFFPAADEVDLQNSAATNQLMQMRAAVALVPELVAIPTLAPEARKAVAAVIRSLVKGAAAAKGEVL